MRKPFTEEQIDKACQHDLLNEKNELAGSGFLLSADEMLDPSSPARRFVRLTRSGGVGNGIAFGSSSGAVIQRRGLGDCVQRCGAGRRRSAHAGGGYGL